MVECENCDYYNADDDVCRACECWPYLDCDAPLPCEKDTDNSEN